MFFLLWLKNSIKSIWDTMFGSSVDPNTRKASCVVVAILVIVFILIIGMIYNKCSKSDNGANKSLDNSIESLKNADTQHEESERWKDAVNVQTGTVTNNMIESNRARQEANQALINVNKVRNAPLSNITGIDLDKKAKNY